MPAFDDPKIGAGLRKAIQSLPSDLLRSPAVYDIPESPFAAAERQRQVQLAEERRRQAEVEAREVKLAELAFAAEERERRRERRERWMFWIAIAGLIFSIIAAVTGTLAIT